LSEPLRLRRVVRLGELRRQQAAFSDTTRKIDLQNSWFAAPVLAAPLVPMGAELLAALGPAAKKAVEDGIAESPAVKAAARRMHQHHLDHKYMGGAEDGPTYDIVDKAHRAAGFPPRGGINGSRIKWAEHYKKYPGSREEAYEILRRVAREFDEKYQTDISSRLSKTPGATDSSPPPPN
jgi:hypothetical protein